MIKFGGGLALMLASLAPAVVYAQPSGSQPGANVSGVWANPHGTLKVEVGNCSKLLCAWVVEASPHQQSAAQKTGTATLIGMNLLQDVKQTSAGSWQGKIFVPERGASYFTKIRQLGPNELKVSGCLLGGLICKSEVWRRGLIAPGVGATVRADRQLPRHPRL